MGFATLRQHQQEAKQIAEDIVRGTWSLKAQKHVVLAVTPDGCPEEIEAGPFTEERAKDALFAWEMNHGCPARVVVLAEQVEPTKFAVALKFNNDERFVHLGAFRHAGSREQVNHYAEESARAGGHPVIYGLVPAKG